MCKCKAVSFVRGILSEEKECVGGNTADFRFMYVRKIAELPVILRCNSSNTTVHRKLNYCTSIEQ